MSKTKTPAQPEFDFVTRSDDQTTALQIIETLVDLFTNHMKSRDRTTGQTFSAADALQQVLGRPLKEVLLADIVKTEQLVTKLRSDDYIVCKVVDDQMVQLRKHLETMRPAYHQHQPQTEPEAK